MCSWCSKEPSHRDGSFEYPKHMFWLRNKKTCFQLRTLIWGLNNHNNEPNADIDMVIVNTICVTNADILRIRILRQMRWNCTK